MLKEKLLHEGGTTLDAKSLEKLNKEYALNNSEISRMLTGAIRSKLTDETKIQGLEQFNQYGDLFQDLTKRTFVDTTYDVVSIIITADSKNCVAIVNNQDNYFELQGYSLTTFEKIFTRKYEGGTYMKMNNIE